MKRQFSIPLHLFVLLALSACGLSKTSPSPIPSPTVTPMPSGMVDVGGYFLYYECSGHGSPTVILENGGGGVMSDWADVFDGIKNTTRVCIYDRANLGRSNSISGKRTLHDMTRDLQVLLENAHIGGPYILVGWSLGGMLVRIFADQHPEEVVGVVLVDSAHPDMGDRLLACLPPESEGEADNVRFARRYTTWISDSSKGSPFTSGEGMGWDTRTNNQQARDVETLGHLPLVVISQAPNIPGLGLPLFTSRGLLPAEIDGCLQQTWQDMQGELAGLSSNTTRMTARGGHMIPVEQPELIIQAIVDLVEHNASQNTPMLVGLVLMLRSPWMAAQGRWSWRRENESDPMNNRNFFTGLAVLAAGLFASSISSFLEHFALCGTATDFARGLFDGLSAVAFVVAIFVLVRNKRTTKL